MKNFLNTIFTVVFFIFVAYAIIQGISEAWQVEKLKTENPAKYEALMKQKEAEDAKLRQKAERENNKREEEERIKQLEKYRKDKARLYASWEIVNNCKYPATAVFQDLPCFATKIAEYTYLVSGKVFAYNSEMKEEESEWFVKIKLHPRERYDMQNPMDDKQYEILELNIDNKNISK